MTSSSGGTKISASNHTVLKLQPGRTTKSPRQKGTLQFPGNTYNDPVTQKVTKIYTSGPILKWSERIHYHNYRGGGCHALRAPTPLCQDRVCLRRGVSPGAYRGAQGRSLKNTWKMFVFNCMIHFVTCIVTISPITELLGYP